MSARGVGIRIALVAAMFTIIAASQPAYAIVVGLEDTSDFSDPGSDWYGMTLDGIGEVTSGSAVAIGNRWFISVAHFGISVGKQIEMSDGTTYTITKAYNPPVPLGQTDPPDLRIVKVAEELDYWYDILDDPTVMVPDVPLIMAGTGFSGSIDPVADTFAWSSGTPRAWRWGTNTFDGPEWRNTPDYRSYCLEMEFVDTDSEYEAGLANGDSGGGTFVLNGDQWELTGVNAYIDRLGPKYPPPYDVSYAVSVLAYIEWIDTIIPTGNINGDSVIDADDIDLLYDYIDSLGGSGSVPPADPLRDLDSDKTVDTGDVDFLIRDILDTEYGDFNLDGLVDTTDLTILATNFGLSGMGYADGDANGDGLIDTTDLTRLATYFGFDASTAASVPEPASIALMGAAALLGLRRRRRA